MTTEVQLDSVERFVTAFRANDGDRLNGRSEHLRDLRRRAIDSFQALGFPKPKEEAWKYTPIARMLGDEYVIDLSETRRLDETNVDVSALRVPGLSGPLVVLIDGEFSEALSTYNDVASGVTVSSLRSAISELPDLIDEHLATYCDIDQQTFEALNTAFVHDGVFIHVKANVSSTQPIEILCLNSGRSKRFIQPRILCLVGDNGSATIVEHQRSLGHNATFSNLVCEIRAGRHARIDHYRLQNESAEASQISNTRIYQQDGSEVSTFTASLGGKLVRNNLHVLPDGEHCMSHLNGLFVGSDNRHIDNHTFVDHAKPNCESNELYKGILGDSSTGVFNGKVFVRRDAQKTNAYQSNKSIVLTESARMFAKPELEIYADDVKCSHGATTGQLDAEALFYLQSRGISAQRAKSILLQAFAGDVMKLISLDEVRSYVEGQVSQHLMTA